MLPLFVNITVLIVWLSLLTGLVASLWRWGGQGEILSVVGEALLLGSRGARPERER